MAQTPANQPVDRHRDTAFDDLFMDDASREEALEGLDLQTPPEPGIERRARAVFRVACQHDTGWRAWFSPVITRMLFRVAIVAGLTVIIGLRFASGSAPQPAAREATHDVVSVQPELSVLETPWKVLVHMVLTRPHYNGPLHSPEDTHLAAVHELTSMVVETLLWGALITVLALLAMDVLRLRRRLAGEPLDGLLPVPHAPLHTHERSS